MQDRNRDAEVENRCVDVVWGKGRWDELGDRLTSVNNHVCKTELWEPAGRPGSSARHSVVTQRGEGGWGWMEVQGGGDRYIHIAASQC